MNSTLTQTRHLSASELRHYASLGMVPDSALAERLPDIAQEERKDAEAENEKAQNDCYAQGLNDGASEERLIAARILKRLRQAILASTFESEYWDVKDAMTAAALYIEKSGIR